LHRGEIPLLKSKLRIADFAIMASLLFARLGFLLLSPTGGGLVGDAVGYVGAAQTIVDSGKLPALVSQSRGYSVLLAPLLMVRGIEIDRAVLITNALMDFFVTALLLWTVKRILPEPKDRCPRLLCWLLVAIQPFTAEMVDTAYTETPTMFFVFVGVWLLFIPNNFGARIVGFASLGVASLLRIEVIVLNIVAIITYLVLFRRKAFDTGAVPLGLAVFCALPIFMLAYQYYSTQEIGLMKLQQLPHSGYYAWMQTWFAIEKTEFDPFAFDIGTTHWPGFDVKNYPSRAFDSATERNRVAELLAILRTAGYIGPVDQGFHQLALEKFKQHPVRSFVLIPMLRMIHYWINIGSAQTYLRVLPLRRPVSTLVVAFTISLRLVLILCAAIGTYFVWLRPPTPISDQVLLARFGSLLVLLRTAELGVLGAVTWGGLMEIRYVIVAFPFVIILSIWGVRYLAMWLSDSLPKNIGWNSLRKMPSASAGPPMGDKIHSYRGWVALAA
jgi:hypothetical protein